MIARRIALLALPGLLALLPLLQQSWAGPGEDTAAAVPAIQRLFVTREKATDQIRRAAEPWREMPRPEFEKLLREAAAGAARTSQVPRVVEARLAAVLRDEELVGLAHWEVACPDACPALLPLQGPGGSFNLAVRKPPRGGESGAESPLPREILLAEVDARGPALILDTPGAQAVELAWSARPERTPEGLTFELRGPASPAGLLELYLPAGWGLSAPANILLTGPLPLPPAEKRGLDQPVPEGFSLWRVYGIGRGAVRLTLNPTGESKSPLILVRNWTSSHRLAPDGVDTTLDAALELLPRGGDEVSFEWEPSLRPYAVEVAASDRGGPVPELASWKLTPGVANRPALLSVRLRQPVSEVVITVKALAPLAAATATSSPLRWTTPEIRVVHGVPRGETIELLLHPDLRLDGWQPGDFRLTGTGSTVDVVRGVTFARLTLTGGGIRSGDRAVPRRPTVLLHPSSVEFRARPVAWWQVATPLTPRKSSLVVQVACEVQHGRLFGVPLQLPPGWEVEQVEVEPASLGATWRPRRESGKNTIQVEFPTPLTPASPQLVGAASAALLAQTRIKMRLRTTTPGVPTNRAIPFPEVIVPGARFREGVLALDIEDELLVGKTTTALPSTDTVEDGPWGGQLPEHYYAYRNQPLQGTLTVTNRPPGLRGHVRTDVFLVAGREEAELRLKLTAEAGSPETVELLLPGTEARGGPPDWKWRVATPLTQGTNQIRSIERLPGPEVLAALGVLGRPGNGGAALAGAVGLLGPPQSRYRITLSRPLRLHEELILAARVRLESREGRWEVPLLVLPRASQSEGAVEIHLAGTDLLQVEAQGLRENGTLAPRGRTAWRAFRYSGNGPYRLALYGREQAAARYRLAEAHARLTAWPGGDGTLRVHYQVHLADWTRSNLPVVLPRGAELLAARVDARPVFVEARADASGDSVVSLPVPARAGATTTELPVPPRGWHRFELLYTVPAASGWLWQTLEAPPPTLPVEPRTFLRTWRLPPGMAPVLAGQATRLPGPGDGIEPPPYRFHPADLFRLVPWPRRWLDASDGAGAPLSTVSLTQALRASRPGQELSLREALEKLALVGASEHKGFVVDAAAWTEGRLRLDARLRLATGDGAMASELALPPVWEQVGLAIVSAPGGWLVTTRRQCDAWLDGGTVLPWPVNAAVEQAMMDGHDRSGRFRWLADWLPMAVREETLPEGRGGMAGLVPLALELPGWSAWSPLEGSTTPAQAGRLVVVRREVVLAAGVVLAILGGLALLGLRTWSRWWRHFWLMVWLALAGVGLFWLPTSLQPLAWYPLVLGGVLVLLAYLRRLRKATGAPEPTSTTIPRVVAGSAALVVLFLAGSAGWAVDSEVPAAPDMVKVLIVGATPLTPVEAVEQQSVLAPASLLDQLRRLRDPVPAVLRAGAVLTGVKCTGQVVDGAAEFNAFFEFHAFGDETTLVVPLEGVNLMSPTWLDDAIANPTSTPKGQLGYQVAARGRGRHKLELRFRVPIQSPSPGEKLVSFALPRLLASRLTFTVPGKGVGLHVSGRIGAEQTKTEGNTTTVEVDLGRVTGPVQLRWSVAAGAAKPVAVRYQEAYLWDLRADASTLTGMLRYSIERGSVGELLLDVPADLVVRRVTATRPGPGEARVQSYRLRDLPPLAGKARQELSVRFQAPLTGDVLLALEMVPRAPLPASVELSLPSPHGEQRGGYLAYKVDGLDARRTGLLRIAGILPAAFAPFWPDTTRPLAKTLAFAATIGRPGGASPELRLQLSPRPAALQVEEELVLRVGARNTSLLAHMDISAPGSELSLLEWEILSPQALTLASVRGAGVRRWSQYGNHLLVWVERTTATKLEMQGWLVTEAKKPARLDLPRLRLLSASKQTTTLRLLAQPGLALRPRQMNGLRAVVNPGAGDPPAGPLPAAFELRYQAPQAAYNGSVLIEAGGPPATARVLTFVEVEDHQLKFQTLIACRIPRGELRSLTVHLRGWAAAAVDLTAERVAQRRDRGHGSERSWVLDLLPGTTEEYSLSLSGTWPLSELTGPPEMPAITLGGVRTAETWLGVVGRGLQAEAGPGLRVAPELPADVPPAWTVPQARVRTMGGAFWKVTATPWQLRLTATAPGRDPDQPCVLLLEERHLRRGADGNGVGRWLHEASVWLRFDRQTELTIQLPRAATVTSVALAGVELPPMQPAPDRLWVPLPGQPGVELLRFRWRYDPAAESLEKPLLEAVRLEATTRSGPTLWTLDVPSGWATPLTTARSDLRAGPGPRVVQYLARAEAALAAARQLGELARDRGAATGRDPLMQQRFYLNLRQAELLRERYPETNGEPGPDGTPASATPLPWATRLAEQNREQAKELKYEDARAEAEKQTRAGLLAGPTSALTPTVIEERLTGLGRGRLSNEAPPWPVGGWPLRGWTTGDRVPALASLRTIAEARIRAAGLDSLIWLGLVTAVALLGRVNFLVRRLRRLIPEQLLLVGGLGYALAGWTPLVLGLLGLGIVARLVALARWLRPGRARRNPNSGMLQRA